MSTIALAMLAGAACTGTIESNGYVAGGDPGGAGSDGPGGSNGSGMDGSGTAPLGPNEARSGTRLKLKRFVYPDGAVQSAGTHDAQLNADCTPTQWTDGKTYCTPAGMQVAFTDSSCTQKIGMVSTPAPCDPPSTSYITEGSTCDGNVVSHVYQKGAQVAPASVYVPSNGACTGPYQYPTYSFYSVGPELTTDQLAALTVTTTSTGTQFDARHFVGADGYVFPAQLHDTAGGFDCSAAAAIPGSAVASCVPDQIASASAFGDATCSASAVASTATGCPAPTYANQPPPDCVYDPPSYYCVGEPVSSSVLYGSTQGTCSAFTPSTGTTYYSTAQSLTVGLLGRVADSTPGQRMQHIQLTSGSLSYQDTVLQDTTLGTECTTQRMSDGTMRCVPRTLAAAQVAPTTVYTDQWCTTPVTVVQIYMGGSDCSAPPMTSYVTKPPASGQCTGIEIDQVGTPITGPVYSNTGGYGYGYGSCAVIPNWQNYAYFTVGAAVPWSNLAQATVQTDP